MEDLEVSFVLQHQLSLQATASIHQASLQRARAMKKTDGGVTVARLVSVSAPRAWAWKSVQPTSRELALTDVQYRIAARLNLGLQPVQAAAVLPDVCVLCADQNRNSIRHDPWHFLSCRALSRGEVNLRHNDVGRALYRCALLMGIRAQLEPRGLDGSSHLRPDLLLTLPGRQILSDVAVIHPLTAGAVVRGHGRRTNNGDMSHRTAVYNAFPRVSRIIGWGGGQRTRTQSAGQREACRGSQAAQVHRHLVAASVRAHAVRL